MSNRFIVLIAVGGLMLMSCSGDESSSDDTEAPNATEQVAEEVTEPEVTEPEVTEPEATEPEATEPEATEPEVTEPEATEPAHTFEMIGCEQVAIYQPIDAATVQERVPAGAEIVVENDQVTSLFVANECTATAVDGAATGPAHVVAQWVKVPGPDEVREGPQFEGADVLPTAYWEPIFTATDNPMLHDRMRAAALDMRLVDSITFEQLAPDTTPEFYHGHAGSITNASPMVDFVWVTMNPWAAAEEIPYRDQPTGFVHVVGDLEVETVGSIRIAGIPGCGLASGVVDDQGQHVDLPDAPIQGQPGTSAAGCLLVAYDTISFETLY